jgi:hypothetical protein
MESNERFQPSYVGVENFSPTAGAGQSANSNWNGKRRTYQCIKACFIRSKVLVFANQQYLPGGIARGLQSTYIGRCEGGLGLKFTSLEKARFRRIKHRNIC